MMAHRKSPHTGFTFFYLALLFAFALLADASSPQQVNHKRLLRKRAPQGLGQPGVNPALTPPSRTSLSASSTAQTDSASSVVPTSTPLIVNPLPSSSSTSVTSSSSSVSSSSSSSSSSSLSSSASSTSTSVSSTSTPSSSSSLSLTPSSSAKSTSTALASEAPSTLTQTATLTKASATPSAQAQGAANSGSSTKKTTTMVIIIIAASVGGVTILWTLFRKWKLGRSSRFDERLQPIDWQPPTGGAHGSEQGHASSDHDHNPISEHDFTPLPSNRLAPAGAYTDLTRGPSPQPEMQEAYGRHSPPVMARPAYDVHIPLHHQAGYGGHGHDVYNHTQFNSGPVGY